MARLELSLLIGALVTYAASLYLLGFQTHLENWYGWRILVFGSLSLLTGCFAWLANVCAIVAVLVWRARRSPVVTALVGLILALTSYSFRGVPSDNSIDRVESWGPGFYCWLAAMLLLFVASLMRSNKSLERTREG